MALQDCALQSGFTMDCRKSIGGLKAAYAVELYNKATLTNSSGVATAFTLKQGKKFWKFEMEQATGTASVDPQPTAANGSLFFNHNLTIIVNKRSAAFNYQIKALAQNDLMWIVETQEGEFYLLGGYNGMKMQPSTGPFGTAMGDRNGYELVFLAMEADPEIQVPSNTMTTLLAPAV